MLLISSSSSSFWQSNIWKSILEQAHQVVETRMISYGVESILVEIRDIGGGFRGAFSLGVDRSLYSVAFFDRVGHELQKAGAIFWQVEEYYSSGVPENTEADTTYGRSFLEPYTRIIQLDESEATILEKMHEKGRYNIRLAEKRGVTTRWVEPTDEHLDIWMSLLSETNTRDEFSINSREYYLSFLQNITQTLSGGLLFAEFEGRVIAAGIFVFHHSIGIYYYGASTSDPELRKHMAPYLIQWVAMLESKSRGCIAYDFLGIAPPGSSPDHRLFGVSQFKEKFGGTTERIGPKSLKILRPGIYKYYSFLRWMRQWLKSLKKR